MATGLNSGKYSAEKKAQALNKTNIKNGIKARATKIFRYFMSSFISIQNHKAITPYIK
jgi:hypothetical protein